MTLSWYGNFCVRILAKGATVLLDPYRAAGGLALPVPSQIAADIVISSRPESPVHGALEAGGKNAFIITAPGEYESRGVFFHGKATPEGITLFRMEAEGITLVSLSALARPLDEAELEHVSDADILMIGVGSREGYAPKAGVALIRQLEPALVVPFGYAVTSKGASADGLGPFLREFGGQPRNEERLKVSKKELLAEGMGMVILKAFTGAA